jgi:NAD(P)-dependent dehydrogenase (short-subunit alcohol dehydrogenase family)
VALVTAAGGHGTGKATAFELARCGAKVIVNDVNAEGVAGVVSALEDRGHEAMGAVADVTDEAAVARMVDDGLARFGQIDILINNATANPRGAPMGTVPFAESKPSDIMSLIEGNVGTAITCSRAVVGGMIERGWGKIVCVTSIAAIWGARNLTGYAAGKAALAGFVASLAKEVGPHGVNVNAILISNAYTPGRPAERITLLSSWSHLGRMGEPEEFARPIRFLASDDASYISGEILHVDGGTSRFALM